MSPALAAREIRKVAADVDGRSAKAAGDVGQMALAMAIALSSGDVSTAELSAGPPGLNHPYGLGPSNAAGPRGPIPFGDPAMINSQTGDFRDHWQIDKGDAGEGSRVFNDADIADLLEDGTSKMVARPIKEAVEASVSPHAEDVARKALRSFL